MRPAGASYITIDLLGSGAEEAPQETPVNRLCTENAPETVEVAQPSSYILPSAEKGLAPPAPGQKGYRARRLNTLKYNGKERSKYQALLAFCCLFNFAAQVLPFMMCIYRIADQTSNRIE